MPQSKFLWDDVYSIGINAIDQQHKHLFDIVNKIFALDSSSEVKEEIRTILYELSDYVKKHFEDEELFMEKIGFPELEYHKQAHQKIIKNVASIMENNYRIDTIQTKMRFIAKRALVDHILNEDMKIKVYQASLHVNEVDADNIIALD